MVSVTHKTGPFKGLSKGTTRVFGFALRFAVTQPSGATARAKDGKGSNSSEHFLFIPKPKALNPHDSIGLLLLFFSDVKVEKLWSHRMEKPGN